MAHTTLSVVVFFNQSRPVLSVSTSWPSPGANVTLNCRFNNSDASWTLTWFKAFPKSFNNSYRHEAMSPSCSGRNRCSYTVHGQTHTSAYVCKAIRGNDTRTSRPTFLWSRDVHENVIEVSPDSVQHVSSESVSLSCRGAAADWSVMRLTEAGHRSNCSEWGTVKGSTCDIRKRAKRTAVYWCQSGSGQFSNAVNITFQTASSSEGSSFPLPLVIGLPFLVVTLTLLLLLCYCRKSKYTFFTRPSKSQKTNQSCAEYDEVDQIQTQGADEANDVTYSLILFKNTKVKGRQNEAEEEISAYDNVKIGSSADKMSHETLYSEVK